MTELQVKFIKEKLLKNYENHKKKLPSGVCESCNTAVSDVIKNGEKATRKIPSQDFEEMLVVLSDSYDEIKDLSDCGCFVCLTVNRKKSASKSTKTDNSQKCPTCFGVKGKGIHKNCGQSERINNLMENLSPRTRLQLSLETIKQEQQKKDSDSPIRVSRYSGGPAMPVMIGNEAKKPKS